MSFKYGTEFNSVYEDYDKAVRKSKRMQKKVKKAKGDQKVIVQKVMYYEDKQDSETS